MLKLIANRGTAGCSSVAFILVASHWIENDDGTPRTIAPACYKTAMRTPVPGSTPHPRGGSHWYFPPAFDLATYNKYVIMGGSYERAGAIGFRCVADAEDDCPVDDR